MGRFLREVCAVDPAVVYDRPRGEFRRAAGGERGEKEDVLRMAKGIGRCVGGGKVGVGGLPRNVVVTCTSWTPDEDFEMLFEAVRTWEEMEAEVTVVITGKGPLREEFEKRVERAGLQFVSVWFVWMPIEEYPKLLAACQVGVSLHASSSGLDLPMKVVDMLGAGLPVAALRYDCIDELVVDGVCGVLFDDARGLAQAVHCLLFESEGVALARKMRENIAQSFASDDMLWNACWKRDALPTLERAAASLA